MKYNSDYFPFPLIVKFIDGNLWELMANFEYYRPNGELIKVPAGFKFDFASIPKFAWSWIGSPTGKYGPASLIHDWFVSMRHGPELRQIGYFLKH